MHLRRNIFILIMICITNIQACSLQNHKWDKNITSIKDSFANHRSYYEELQFYFEKNQSLMRIYVDNNEIQFESTRNDELNKEVQTAIYRKIFQNLGIPRGGIRRWSDNMYIIDHINHGDVTAGSATGMIYCNCDDNQLAVMHKKWAFQIVDDIEEALSKQEKNDFWLWEKIDGNWYIYIQRQG